jgi:DNA-directed RNA polymerase alpha subunit
MKTASAITGLLLSLMMDAAQGKECKGINFPDQVEVAGTHLTLNGLGVQKATFLNVDVYVGALYVTATSRDPNPLIDSDAPQVQDFL